MQKQRRRLLATLQRLEASSCTDPPQSPGPLSGDSESESDSAGRAGRKQPRKQRQGLKPRAASSPGVAPGAPSACGAPHPGPEPGPAGRRRRKGMERTCRAPPPRGTPEWGEPSRVSGSSCREMHPPGATSQEVGPSWGVRLGAAGAGPGLCGEGCVEQASPVAEGLDGLYPESLELCALSGCLTLKPGFPGPSRCCYVPRGVGPV